MAKPIWAIVATSGATVDNRFIKPEWLKEAAEQYDPKTYGARVNMEHIRSYWADSEFKMYGDVLALKTSSTDDDKTQLIAKIEPTDELVKLNKLGQKVYTSVEIDDKFSDTGKAYLVGVAITDSPASLGTSRLKFSQHENAKTKFTKPMEFTVMPEPESKGKTEEDEITQTDVSEQKSFTQKMKELLNFSDKKATKAQQDLAEGVELFAKEFNTFKEEAETQIKALSAKNDALSESLTKTQEELEEFKQQEVPNPTRPESAGGDQYKDIV